MQSTTTPHVVLVHGNPETDIIWQHLDAALRERGVARVTRLSPPGFGAPLPESFAATTDAYLGWLAGELEALQADDAPIDLVGHDWGAGHVYRLAAERPDLIRSWAADVGGLLHPDYQWHDAAKAWQEPEVGEQVIEMMTAMPLEDRVGMYTGFGISTEMAEPMAAAVTPDMGRAILALYRSAREPQLREFADRLASADHGPGLIITATDDAYVSAEMAGPVAERLGIDELVLDGQGHWWMVHDAERAANGLIRFWNEL